MKREIIKATPEHEQSFRESFELRADLKNDPYWEMAFEHAATHCLYPDELNAIGQAIVRKIPSTEESSNEVI